MNTQKTPHDVPRSTRTIDCERCLTEPGGGGGGSGGGGRFITNILCPGVTGPYTAVRTASSSLPSCNPVPRECLRGATHRDR